MTKHPLEYESPEQHELDRLQALNTELVAALKRMMKGNERPLDGDTVWQRVVMPSDYACTMAYEALKKAGE